MKPELHNHAFPTAPQLEEHRKRLNAFNVKQEWTVQCWNCRKPLTRSLADLAGPCPHCGVELSKRA